jgi:pimeloyl-ACP methyl ester carboxylesterase
VVAGGPATTAVAELDALTTAHPVDAYLEEPRLAAAVTGLAAGRRVLALDRRGPGLSPPRCRFLGDVAWVLEQFSAFTRRPAGQEQTGRR